MTGKRREHRKLRASHPGLSAQLQNFFEQGGTAGGVQMGDDLVKQKNGRKTFFYMGKRAGVRKDDRDKERFLLPRGALRDVHAFGRIPHGKFSQMRTKTNAAAFVIAYTGA